MAIGDIIRERRTELGLTLEALGQTIGVTRAAVHYWEIREEAKITIANRIALSEALDIPLAELLPPTAPNVDGLTDEESKLIAQLRAASPRQRETVLRLIAVDLAAERDRYRLTSASASTRPPDSQVTVD